MPPYIGDPVLPGQLITVPIGYVDLFRTYPSFDAPLVDKRSFLERFETTPMVKCLVLARCPPEPGATSTWLLLLAALATGHVVLGWKEANSFGDSLKVVSP